MCSAAVTSTCTLAFARSARSLLRTAFSDASLLFWPTTPTPSAPARQSPNAIPRSDSAHRGFNIFDNFIACYDLRAAAQGRRYTTVFLIREFDCLGHRRLRKLATPQDMFHKQTCVGSRKILAAFAADFDAVIHD